MKNFLILGLTCICATLFSGCTIGNHQHGIYETVPSGFFYSEVITPTSIERNDPPDYTILGYPEFTYSTTAIMLCASWGGTSVNDIRAAFNKQFPKADDFIDIEVTSDQTNVMFVYNNIEITVRAKAIKFKESPNLPEITKE